MKIVFFSLTGQTRRFIKKLKLEDSLVIELKRREETPILEEDFILFTPSYEAGLEFQDQFLEKNKAYFKGVIGSGNRNFGPEFCHTAREYAQQYNIPVLYEYEFNGTTEDVENVKKILSSF